MLPPSLIDMSPLFSKIVKPRSTNVFITKDVDIKQYPARAHRRFLNTITLGDMHGNPMKLIWILIHEGVIRMDKEDFEKMWEIYENLYVNYESVFLNMTPKKFSLFMEKNRIGLKAFIGILDTIQIVDIERIVRLLGDFFAERGCNDYLNLKILEKFIKSGIKIEIVCSNHDIWLLENYKIKVEEELKKSIKSWYKNKEWCFTNANSQQNSLLGLFAYIKFGIVEQTEVEELVETCVIPCMKPISYALSIDGKTIDIFMHAPNNFDVIDDLVKDLQQASNVEYDISSAVGFAKTIDAINEMFYQLSNEQSGAQSFRNVLRMASYTGSIINTPPFSKEQFFKYLDIKGFNFSDNEKKAGFSLGRLVWNRLPATGGCINFKTWPDFVNYLIHGHTGVRRGWDNRQKSLDSYLGKDGEKDSGVYSIFCTMEYPLLEIIESLSLEDNDLLSPIGSAQSIECRTDDSEGGDFDAGFK